MELTLRFRGELPAATKSNARVLDKHRIRKDLHNQLAVFWAQHRSLVDINKDLKGLQITKRARGVFDVDRPIIGMKNFFWRYPLCGYDFIPLVTHVHELHCHLDIRVYRRLDQRGILFEGGDLDNRLKTFFDALRVPAEPSQIPEELDTPEMEFHTKEWPHMFCLLDDDKAIKKLSIQSLKMLTPIPENCEHPENYTEYGYRCKYHPSVKCNIAHESQWCPFLSGLILIAAKISGFDVSRLSPHNPFTRGPDQWLYHCRFLAERTRCSLI